MPLLQLLGLLRDELLDLRILAAERGGERLLTGGKLLLLGVQRSLLLPPGSLVLGGLFLHHLLGLLDVSLLQDELPLVLGQLVLGSLQSFLSLTEPGLRLSDALLQIYLRLVHLRHPGGHLVQAGTVVRLEFLKVGTHGLEKLLLLGTAVAGARFVDNLEPDGGEGLIVKNLPFGWRSGACCLWGADGQIIVHL